MFFLEIVKAHKILIYFLFFPVNAISQGVPNLPNLPRVILIPDLLQKYL